MKRSDFGGGVDVKDTFAEETEFNHLLIMESLGGDQSW
jgi:hypothetical protein